MRVLAFLLLLITSTYCHGQIDSTGQNRLCVKFSPLCLLGGYAGPSVRISVEYKIKNNFHLENEVGTFFNYSRGFFASVPSRGYLTRLELKYYLPYPYTGGRNYLSAELFYKNQSYVTSDSFGAVLQEYRVTKNVECLTFKFGGMIIGNAGLILEGYVGAGVRFQQNKNTLSFEDNENIPQTLDYNVNTILNRAQNRVYPNIVAGIKIGIRLLK